MSPDIHLAVDAMGGDFGPRLSVPASLSFLEQFSDCRITLLGDSAAIRAELQGRRHERLNVQHAPDEVLSTDKPSFALRNRRQSSLWQCLELVHQGVADVCVSGGNTGALMAIGKYLIGTFGGIERPAICKAVPTQTGFSYLLDIGANLDCSANNLVQFAVMGACLARTGGVSNPTVALLNVGHEQAKGSAVIQEAAQKLMKMSAIRFSGFVEGDGLYRGEVDVIVCDGFAGNVALKTSEGAASLLFRGLENNFSQSLRTRFARWLVRRELASWREAFSPSRYNGAALLGLCKPVIKSHGGTDLQGFCQALGQAREQVLGELVQRVERELRQEVPQQNNDL